MNYTLTPSAGQQPAYPDRAERNPKKKTDEWIAHFGWAYACDFMRQAGTWQHWHHAASENVRRLQYLFGKQETGQYERFADPADADNDPAGLDKKLDKRILPVVPKHVRILTDKLAEYEFAPAVSVVDERAEEDKETHLESIRLWQQQGDWLRQAGVRPPADLPAELPADEDDLRTYAESEYQHDDAVAMEQKISLCLADANYKQLDRDITLHFVGMQEACLYLGVGPGGRALPTLLRPGNVLLLPSNFEDYRDARAAAHLDTLTLAQLRAEAGEEFWEKNKAQLVQAATRGTSSGSGWWLPQGLGDAQDMERVRVLRFSFLSEDDIVWKTKKDKLGNSLTERKTADPKAEIRGGEVTRRTATNVYEGVLVLDTPLHYNCRLAVKQLRDCENPLRGLLPYAACTPGLIEGQSACVMDEVMPMADYCQRQWLRLQEACIRAVPQGYNFDPEALAEAAAMLKGNDLNKGLDLKKAIRMFYRDGNTVSKRTSRNGQPLPSAITRNEIVGYEEIDKYWNNLRAGLQMLESILGSNAVVSAATPNPEVGVGQSELAVQGTMSSLGYLLAGKRMLFDNICRTMGIRIWLTEAKQPVTGSVALAPGKAPVRVKPRPGLARRVFNFRIERKPTAEDRAEFKAMLVRGIDAGSITEADYAYLLEVDNVKEAWRILAQRAKKNRRQKQQDDQRNQMMTFEGQIKSAQETEKAKRETMTLGHQQAMELEALRQKGTARVATIYTDGTERNEQERADAKLLDTRQRQEGDLMRELASQATTEPEPGAAARQEFSQLAQVA